MPRHVQGRRVASVEDIEHQGDYAVSYTEDGRIEALWLWLPGFEEPRWSRIGAQASKDRVRWDISEDASGTITVSPSILSQWIWGEERKQCRWHGFLKGGIWEVLDDTVGAEFD